MSSYEGKAFGNLGSYLAKEDVEYMTEYGAELSIKVANSTTPDAVYEKLVKWTEFDVYKKADIPDHLHFRDHRNILDILMVSKGKELVGSFSKNSANILNFRLI